MVRSTKVLALAVLLAGCSSPSQPDDRSPIAALSAPQRVRLTLRLSTRSGGPGHIVRAFAVAHNGSDVPVFHWDGCGFWNGNGLTHGIEFEFFGPDGTRVETVPWMRPLCPDYAVRLDTGMAREAMGPFDGTLYDPRTLSAYGAPAGRYTVVVRFRWSLDTDVSDPVFMLEERATFFWAGGTGPGRHLLQ